MIDEMMKGGLFFSGFFDVRFFDFFGFRSDIEVIERSLFGGINRFFEVVDEMRNGFFRVLDDLFLFGGYFLLLRR